MAKATLHPGTALSPVPVVLVTAGTQEESDITTLAWAGMLCSDPPMIGIGVRPTRWLHHFIVDQNAIVVNVPDVLHVRQLDLCGTISGKKKDKWDLTGFTRERGSTTETPLIAECPLNLECVVRQTLHLGSHDLFIGEIVAVHVEERIRRSGRLDASAFDPVCYIDGQYRHLGGKIGDVGFSHS